MEDPAPQTPTQQPQSQFDITDGGWTSRKLIFCAAIALLIAGVGLATGWKPAIGSIYPTLVGGLLGIATIFCGHDVAGKYITGKHMLSEMEKQLKSGGDAEASPDPKA